MLKSWELPQFSTDFENTAKKINKMHSGHQFDDVITCIFILLFNTWFSSLKKLILTDIKKKFCALLIKILAEIICLS